MPEPITEELKRGSETAKARRVTTTNELPVYRAGANVLFLITDAVRRAPRKMVRLTDRIVGDAAELLKCIALANEYNGEERAYYISGFFRYFSIIGMRKIRAKRQYRPIA